MVKTQDSVTPSSLSRRRLLQIFGAVGALGAVYYFGFSPGSGIKPVKHTQLMMGTIVNITVCSEDEKPAKEAIDACVRRMQGLSNMLSTYVADSPLSQLKKPVVLNLLSSLSKK